MLYTPRMVWSRMRSHGTQQSVKMMYVVGEQGVAEGVAPDGIGIPNLQGIYIGNSALDAIYADSFAFYWKRNTTSSDETRIRKDNRVYGNNEPWTEDEENDDAFLCPTSEGTNDTGFCSAHSLSNNAQFGCYAPIRNGTTYRVNWSTIPIPHVSDDKDDDPRPYMRGYERFKIAGDKIDANTRQDHDGDGNRTQNQGQPGEGRNYSCRMGIVDYYKGGTKYQSRTGNGTEGNAWIPQRVYDGVEIGDICLFEIRPQKDRIREDLYDDVKVDDINSAIDEMRRAADEQMQLGELFMIGACTWKVIRRSKTIWGSVDLSKPEDDTVAQHIHLECIDNNNGSFNKIGVVASSIINPTKADIQATKIVKAGTVSDRKEWEDRGGSYGPVDGDGFIGDSPFFGDIPGSSFYPLLKIAKGIVRNNRKCDVTEIGLRSIVYQQINGLCNFQSIPTVSELKKLDGDGIQVQSGTINSYLQRASAFVLQWRPSGSTDDTEWKEFAVRFVVIGGTTSAQYNSIRIKHPDSLSAYEYKFVPLNSGVIKENSQTQDLIELLKERGFHETNAPMFDKVSDKFRGDHDEMEFVTNNPNYLKFSHFDPFSFGETEPQSNLINIICKNKDKIIFIGCPHSFIKDIEFNPNAIIVDIWGIVEQKDYMNHKIIRSI